MYIPPSPEVENFEMKIYYPAGDRTPDLLNQRQTCYHLNQHGEHDFRITHFEMYIILDFQSSCNFWEKVNNCHEF